MRISARAMAFWGLVLGYATAAHACGSHIPDSVSTLPGMGFYRPDMLLLFPILTGTLERPIYSLAGYKVSTLAYSIQANFLASILIGIVGFFGYSVLYDVSALVLFFAAPFIAMAIKLWWFNLVPRDDSSRPRIGWFFLATLLSTITLATIPLWMNLFGTDRYAYAEKVQMLKAFAILMTLVATIVIHVAIFTRYKREFAADTRRGFEVLPAHADAAMPIALPAATE